MARSGVEIFFAAEIQKFRDWVVDAAFSPLAFIAEALKGLLQLFTVIGPGSRVEKYQPREIRNC